MSLEDFDFNAPVQLDRRYLDELLSLRFLAHKEHVIFVWPVGVGKTFLVQALGTAAIRAGHSVLFRRADRPGRSRQHLTRHCVPSPSHLTEE